MISTTTTSTTTTTLAPLTFTAIADTYVDASTTSSIFGTSSIIFADASPIKQLFVRFTVSGLAAAPSHATLRLTVGSGTNAPSDVGGTLQVLNDNTWSEASTNYTNRPTSFGASLGTQGAVAANQVVDFNATSAITGNGTFNFVITSTSSNGVEYLSRESASGKPQLIVTP